MQRLMLALGAILSLSLVCPTSLGHHKGEVNFVGADFITSAWARSNYHDATYVGVFEIKSSSGHRLTGTHVTRIIIDTDRWHVVPIPPRGRRSDENWSQIYGGVWIERTLYLSNGERLYWSGGVPRQGVSPSLSRQSWTIQTLGWYKDGYAFRRGGSASGRLAQSLGHSRGLMGSAGGWGNRFNIQILVKPLIVLGIETHPINLY